MPIDDVDGARRPDPAGSRAVSASSTKRLSSATRTGKPAKRSVNRREVLARQQRRGHQEAACLLSWTALKIGAHRDLGLAEADVGADQAVHRARQLHVGLDVVDGLGLVGGQRVGEEGLHLALPRGVGAERVPDRHRALAVEVDELLGDEERGRAGLGARSSATRRRPCATARARRRPSRA